MKKIVSWCIVLTIAFGLMFTPNSNYPVYAGGLNDSIFEDIVGHWAQEYIEKFYGRKWVVGYEDGLFRPDRYVTRAEFTAMVVHIFKGEIKPGDSVFSDVIENDWFYDVVNYANSEGLIKGYEDGTFRPRNNMSRQDAAVLVSNLFDVDFFTGAQEYKFTDEDTFPEYSYQSIKNLASHEIVKGYPDGTFRPSNLITRAEAVRMLDVVLKYIEIPSPEIPEAPPVTPSPDTTSTSTPTPTPTPGNTSNGNKGVSKSTPKATPVPEILDIDLKPVKVNIADTMTDPQTLQISGRAIVEIENGGNDPVKKTFEVTIFEDTNLSGGYDKNDNILGVKKVRDSVYGASINVSVEVKGTVLFRDNPLYAFVDSRDVVVETNEQNNQLISNAGCENKPPVGSFDPVLEWKWDTSEVFPNSINVLMTPVIMDMDGDTIPDVVFGSTESTGGNQVEVGILRAISGDSGKEIFSVTDSVYRINVASSIAAADIDIDGKPEIIACDTTGQTLIAFENDGTFKWRSPQLQSINWGAPSIADIDNDGVPEIIIGNQVLNSDGTIRWTGTGGKGGKAFGSSGPLSFAVNIDMDDELEIICGNTVYKADGSILWQNNGLYDGHNAVANFDDDLYPEIVLVGNGYLWLLEHDGEVKWGPVTIPGGGRGGPPTVADFDNDGKVEIGVAAAARYTVFNDDGTVLWSSVTQDKSSNVTGSSVFDFEGDGSYEVVYRDELKLRIYSGMDGTILFEIPMSSCTWYEYPLVADVDSDGNAEIIVVANNNCGYGIQRGVYVFGDANDTWVNTCKVWNQHAYSITNINSDGTIPSKSINNWEIFNNFRCNQSIDALACVDLTMSYLRITPTDDSYTLTARIGNAGTLYAPKGVNVSFYSSPLTAEEQNSDETRELIATAIMENQINPGEFKDISVVLQRQLSGNHVIYAVVDDGSGHGMVREIDETNNTTKCEFSFDSGSYTPTPTSTPMPTPTDESVQIKDIDPAEAFDLIKNTLDEEIVILDVRTLQEFEEGHIENAINADVNSDLFNDMISSLDKNKVYLVYCASGTRSIKAANMMKEKGFHEIYNLNGGITRWKNDGFQVTE